MKAVENIVLEFIDAIRTANSADAFGRVGTRLAQRLGFQHFAYLGISEEKPMLISSYPTSWTDRYFHLGYQELDPVIRRARLEYALFGWGGNYSPAPDDREQRRFLDEAMAFGIRSGVTVPIRAGFGRLATFTLATADRDLDPDRLVTDVKNVVQLGALYFHAHVAVRLDRPQAGSSAEIELTQRECQCLAWIARGKTVADVAVLVGITPRTVGFHLDNARRKLGAASIAHCVAEALRRGWLS